MYFDTADHWIIFLPIRCISARTGTKINQGDLCSTGSVAPWYKFDWIHSRNKQWLTSVETETLWASLSMSQHINSATGKKWVKQLFLVSWTSLYRNSIHSWLDQKLLIKFLFLLIKIVRVKVIGQNSFLLNLNSFLDKQTFEQP